ncbi:chemokine (C-X-C motif) ligand 12 [Cricetulus griseus]
MNACEVLGGIAEDTLLAGTFSLDPCLPSLVPRWSPRSNSAGHSFKKKIPQTAPRRYTPLSGRGNRIQITKWLRGKGADKMASTACGRGRPKGHALPSVSPRQGWGPYAPPRVFPPPSKQQVQVGDWEDQRSQHPAGPGTPRAPREVGGTGRAAAPQGMRVRDPRHTPVPPLGERRPAPPRLPFASKAPSARLPLPHFHSLSTSVSSRCPALQPPARPPAHAMDAKVVAVLALVLAALCISDGKCNPRPGPRRAGSSAPWLPQVPGSSARVLSRGERSRLAPVTASELEAATLQGALPAGKPVSLSYRCPCRFFESHVSRSNVKHLKILNTPNCALQIVARLKSNNRQVCIDPKLKWIQEYLDKALNKERGLETSSLLCVEIQICALCCLHCAAGSRGQWVTSKEVQQNPLVHCLFISEGPKSKRLHSSLGPGLGPGAWGPSSGFCYLLTRDFLTGGVTRDLLTGASHPPQKPPNSPRRLVIAKFTKAASRVIANLDGLAVSEQ